MPTVETKPPIGHNRGPPLDEIELNRVVDLKEAARLRNLSIATLKRHYRHQIITLSLRRCGMRLKHALGLE
jgi:hypothetical protein